MAFEDRVQHGSNDLGSGQQLKPRIPWSFTCSFGFGEAVRGAEGGGGAQAKNATHLTNQGSAGGPVGWVCNPRQSLRMSGLGSASGSGLGWVRGWREGRALHAWHLFPGSIPNPQFTPPLESVKIAP